MLARYGGAFATSLALHAAIAAALAWPGSQLVSRRASERPIEIVLLPPAEDSRFPGLKPVSPEGPAQVHEGLSVDRVLAGADVQRIADHMAVLFPFVTPGLALDAFFPRPDSPTRLVFENPLLSRSTAVKSPAGRHLHMSDAAIQAVVDKAWTRGNRLRAFDGIAKMIGDYDADDERLATLVRRYRDQNGLEPYADGPVRDLRLWAQLGLAADHVGFIGFIRQFVSAHPSTRVSTELLFFLDTLAQANEDALAVLVETNQPGDLEWTRSEHPRAYQLAKDIQRQYGGELTRRGLSSRIAMERYYDDGRLAILAGILQTTPDGYRANDARFLIGSILWRHEKYDAAVRIWRTLRPTGDDTYAIAIDQVRSAVVADRPSVRDVGYILKNQQARWLFASEERLRRFGYRVDLF
jgi:hypothetical protein